MLIIEGNNDFQCKRCGKCCLNECILFDGIDLDEWKPIIELVNEKYNGVLNIKCNCGCDDFTKFKMKTIDDIIKAKNDTESDLYWALDYGQCPFIKKKDGAYFCEIYEIRPQVCRKYQCDNDF